jgi:putative inorganic carbon (hco3(-)) transporter
MGQRLQNKTTKPRNKIIFSVEAAFLLLVFSLGFMQPQVNFRGISLTLTDLFFILLFILWLSAVLLKQIEWRFERVYLLFALYGGTLVLSAIFSADPRHSFLKLLGEFYLFALAILTSNIARRIDVLKRTAFVWIAGASISSLIGVLAVAFFYLGINNFLTDFAFRDFGSLPPGNYTRIQSTFLYPAILCNYLTVGMMLLFAAWESAWLRTTLMAVLLIPIGIAAVFTLTPGIGGMLLAAGMWIWFLTRESKTHIVGNIALASGIAAAAAFLLVSAVTIFNSPTSPFYWTIAGVRIDPAPRLQTWMDAGRTFLANPVLGKGLGMPAAQVYFMTPSGQMQVLTDAHNFLFNIAAQAGLFGLFSIILICIAVVRSTCAARDTAPEVQPFHRCLCIAFISAFIYQGLVGSFEDCRHLWVLIGLLIGSRGLNNETLHV